MSDAELNATVRVDASGVNAANSVQSGVVHGGIHVHQSSTDHIPQAVPRQLPSAVRHFVNRAVEQDALTTLSYSAKAGGSMVISAIDGTAGIGKSTLVVHWAHGARDRFTDGELYVNLRGFDPSADPVRATDALGALLTGLGIPPDQQPADLDTRAALFRSSVHGKNVLVLLDNARSAEQVRPLLPGSPSCLVLVTSRNRLEDLVIQEGATRMTLDVLTTSEARDLLVRHLTEDRVAAEPEAVTALIEHCAGLPLALSIVAYRAAENPDFPLSVLVSSLRNEQDRLDELDTGGQSGVRSVFSWSYRSLSQDAAGLFRLLGLPTGPDISLDAAADLVGLPRRKARTLLTELTRAHLVEQRQPGRYEFHDLLRAYAAECAAEAETPDTRHAALRRLLDHYLRTSAEAQQLISPHAQEPLQADPPSSNVEGKIFTDQEEALAWWDTEKNNVVAAIQQSDQLRLDEHTWQLAHSLRYFFKLRDHTDEWITTFKVALAAAKRLGNPSAEASLLLNLGIAHFTCRQFDLSADYKSQAVVLFEQLNDQTHLAIALVALGEAKTELQQYEEALDPLQRGIELATQTADHLLVGAGHAGLGTVHAKQKSHDQARDHFERALVLYRQVGEEFGQGYVLDLLARTHLGAGKIDDARETYRLAVDYRREIGHRQGEATSLRGLGDALRATGDLDGARVVWQKAMSILDQLGDSRADEVRALLNSE